jgi:hypothetical protein
VVPKTRLNQPVLQLTTKESETIRKVYGTETLTNVQLGLEDRRSKVLPFQPSGGGGMTSKNPSKSLPFQFKLPETRLSPSGGKKKLVKISETKTKLHPSQLLTGEGGGKKKTSSMSVKIPQTKATAGTDVKSISKTKNGVDRGGKSRNGGKYTIKYIVQALNPVIL